MPAELRRLSPDLGVEISGVDFRTLDDDKSALFRKAFADHQLVLIRNADLSDEQGTALSELLGPVSFVSPVMRQGGGRKFSYIGNQQPDGKLRDGELLFHADHSFHSSPLKAISLYSLAAPSEGGETLYINAAAAYRRLPPALKKRIGSLEARHIAEYSAFAGDERPRYDPNSRAKVAVHPVVWRHPDSGEPILFVSRLLTESILGMDYDDSEALLQELFTYTEDASHQYAHKWQVGDFVIWDNRQLQHARRDFDPGQPRSLRRVPIDEPVTAAA